MGIIAGSLIDAFATLKEGWGIFSKVWFLVLPMPLFWLFEIVWLDYKRRATIIATKYVLLEITPPRDIEKSPQPMESVFNGIAGILKSPNPIEEFVDGFVNPAFSLEIAGFEGSVHFYIRCPKFFRNLMESHVYAQYPSAEIMEVPDYVDNVPKLVPNKDWELWGSDFRLVKPDPYPIRTYKFFEETISGEMIDPLSSLVETMSKLPLDQQIWLQYVIVPLKEGSKEWEGEVGKQVIDEFIGKAKKRGGIFEEILGDLGDVISNLIPALSQPVEFAKEEKKDEGPIEFKLTPGQKEVLKALESNIGKYAFTTKMRLLYLGKRENFSKANLASFIGGIKQFADFNLNGLAPEDVSKTAVFGPFTKERTLWRQRKIFNRYKYRDTTGKKFIFSSEELATVFHMPDMSVVAPGISKVEFKRGGAPSNLPIG